MHAISGTASRSLDPTTLSTTGLLLRLSTSPPPPPALVGFFVFAETRTRPHNPCLVTKVPTKRNSLSCTSQAALPHHTPYMRRVTKSCLPPLAQQTTTKKDTGPYRKLFFLTSPTGTARVLAINAERARHRPCGRAEQTSSNSKFPPIGSIEHDKQASKPPILIQRLTRQTP